MNVDGASAIVSGLREMAARQLAALGIRARIADLNGDRGPSVAAELGGLFVKRDVASEADGLAAVVAADDMPLRVLVKSAGMGPPMRTVDRSGAPMPQRNFDEVIRVNLLGSFNMLPRRSIEPKNEPFSDDGQRGAIVNRASDRADTE